MKRCDMTIKVEMKIFTVKDFSLSSVDVKFFLLMLKKLMNDNVALYDDDDDAVTQGRILIPCTCDVFMWQLKPF